MTDQTNKQPDGRLRDLIDTCLKTARSQLVDDGKITPAVLVCHGENEVEVVPAVFNSPADKDRLAFMVRGLAGALDAHTIVLASEIWTLASHVKPEEYKHLLATYKEVRLMPGRIEAVMVNVETRDGEKWHAQAEILRKGRAVQLGPVEYRNLAGMETGGRFAGWFAPERPIPGDLTREQG
jgi:hypothetical protein